MQEELRRETDKEKPPVELLPSGSFAERRIEDPWFRHFLEEELREERWPVVIEEREGTFSFFYLHPERTQEGFPLVFGTRWTGNKIHLSTYDLSYEIQIDSSVAGVKPMEGIHFLVDKKKRSLSQLSPEEKNMFKSMAWMVSQGSYLTSLFFAHLDKDALAEEMSFRPPRFRVKGLENRAWSLVRSGSFDLLDPVQREKFGKALSEYSSSGLKVLSAFKSKFNPPDIWLSNQEGKA